tara:strand:- start:385 stop:573 length:189 start_codon:yes stop_codon:yes gene_type:complete
MPSIILYFVLYIFAPLLIKIYKMIKTKGKIIWAVLGCIIGIVISSIYWANLADDVISGFTGK